jgi:hypothetical protein
MEHDLKWILIVDQHEALLKPPVNKNFPIAIIEELAAPEKNASKLSFPLLQVMKAI